MFLVDLCCLVLFSLCCIVVVAALVGGSVPILTFPPLQCVCVMLTVTRCFCIHFIHCTHCRHCIHCTHCIHCVYGIYCIFVYILVYMELWATESN